MCQLSSVLQHSQDTKLLNVILRTGSCDDHQRWGTVSFTSKTLQILCEIILSLWRRAARLICSAPVSREGTGLPRMCLAVLWCVPVVCGGHDVLQLWCEWSQAAALGGC